VVRYTASASFTGDAFTYRASDGLETSNVAKVTILQTQPWWDEAWTRRRLVTIDTTGLETANDIPVFVGGLDRAQLVTEGGRMDGADLRFVSFDGQELLSHEVGPWTRAVAGAWVRVPVLEAPVTRFWMYYANANAPMAPPASDVWSGFGAVFHLDGSLHESVTDTPGSRNETYVPAVHGVGVALMSEEDLDFSMPPGLRVETGSLCAWVSIRDITSRVRIWRIEGSSDAELEISVTSSRMLRGAMNDGRDLELLAADRAASLGWNFVCVEFDTAASSVRVLLDGDEVDTSNSTGSFDADRLRFGGTSDTNFRGPFDEVWFSTVVRPDAWYRAQAVLGHESRVTVPTAGETLPL
jgi:hypothetical protein